MNRLQFSSSPYLLQHADNPVDWYPWSAEALDRAKSENKPILVSIGYSTCHWCHVMERESFESQEVADYMNAAFVCIKVDREERPDLDAIYMEACQIIAGTAGWPLNVFLTPDLKPFHAGTYFPPEPRSGLPSWMETLQFVAYNFYENRTAVDAQAEKIYRRLQGEEEQFLGLQPASAKKIVDKEFFLAAFRKISKSFDKQHGGFGEVPKFPQWMALTFLQKMDYYFPETGARRHLDFSLRKMLNGGIYDQIGGGIARYATDKNWLIPHFEKMLYDNALLGMVLAQNYKQSRSPFILRKLHRTLDFVVREMTDPKGGFYAALDADSDGDEGKYYTWTSKEIEEALGANAQALIKYWGVSRKGNWEGKNILWCPDGESQDPYFFREVDEAAAKLLALRNQRIRPHLDKKVLLNWNALICKAFVLAFQATGESKYQSIALKNIDFLTREMMNDEHHLFHVWTNGKASINGLSTDYALLIDALLSVYELDFDHRFLAQAEQLTEVLIQDFWDEKSGLFFATADNQNDVVLRKKDIYDSEIPSTNAAMVYNLRRLGLLLDKPEYIQTSERMLLVTKSTLEKHPLAFVAWLNSAFGQYPGLQEIAIIGENALEKAAELVAHYIPDRIIAASAQATDSSPLLRGKNAEKDALIYVCKNYACQRPVRDISEIVDGKG